MSPSRFAIQLTYLENLAKLHQFYTAQRGQGNAPDELVSLLRTEIQRYAAHAKPTRLMPTLPFTHRLTQLSTALGCNHSSAEAENLCVFAELHRLILQWITVFKNLKLEGVHRDEQAAKKGKVWRSRRREDSDEDEDSAEEASNSDTDAEQSEGGTWY